MTPHTRKQEIRCNDAAVWISVKVDGEALPGEVAVRLGEHLAACPSCRETLAREERRSSLLAGALATRLATGAGGGELRQAILTAAATGDRAGGPFRVVVNAFRRRRLPRLAALAAAALVAGLLGWRLVPREAAPEEGIVAPGRQRPIPVTGTPVRFEFSQQYRLDDVAPDADGSPRGRGFEHDRRLLIFPRRSASGSSRPAPEPEPGVIIDLERVRPVYPKLPAWPYQ